MNIGISHFGSVAPKARQTGSTLVEAVVTFVIIGVALLALLTFSSSSFINMSNAEQRAEATLFAQAKLEELTGLLETDEFLDRLNRSEVNALCGSDDAAAAADECQGRSATFDRSWAISAFGGDNLVQQAIVTVSWTDQNNDAQSVQVSSVVRRYNPEDEGLNFYAAHTGLDGGDSWDGGGSGEGSGVPIGQDPDPNNTADIAGDDEYYLCDGTYTAATDTCSALEGQRGAAYRLILEGEIVTSGNVTVGFDLDVETVVDADFAYASQCDVSSDVLAITDLDDDGDINLDADGNYDGSDTAILLAGLLDGIYDTTEIVDGDAPIAVRAPTYYLCQLFYPINRVSEAGAAYDPTVENTYGVGWSGTISFTIGQRANGAYTGYFCRPNLGYAVTRSYDGLTTSQILPLQIAQNPSGCTDGGIVVDEGGGGGDGGDGGDPGGADQITVTYVENAEAIEGASMSFAVTLSGTTTATTSYSVGFSKISADLGTDFSTTPVFTATQISAGYGYSNGAISVPSGVTSFSFSVSTVQDTLKEKTQSNNWETFAVAVGTVTAIGKIIDND